MASRSRLFMLWRRGDPVTRNEEKEERGIARGATKVKTPESEKLPHTPRPAHRS